MTFPKGSGIVVGANGSTRAPWADGDSASPFPLGSAILRAPIATDAPPYDSQCFNQRIVIDNFSSDSTSRTAQTVAMPSPFCAWFIPASPTMCTYPVGFWAPENDGGAVFPIVLPGVDLHNIGYSKVSAVLPEVVNIGGGYPSPYIMRVSTPNSVTGTFSISSSEFGYYRDPIVGVDYEMYQFGGSTGNRYVTFRPDDGTYHPEATGTGTLTVTRMAGVGHSGDFTRVSGGIGTLYQASASSWGVGLYDSSVTQNATLTSPAARDYGLYRFVFRTNRLGIGRADVSFGVGNSFLTIAPGADHAPGVRGYVSLNTGAETVEIAKTDFAPNTWYNAEIQLDLVSGVSSARVFKVGDSAPDFIEAATGGERIGDSGYVPTIVIRMRNEDAGVPWQVDLDIIEADIATTGPFAAGYANSNNLVITIKGGSGFGNAYGAERYWPSSDPGDGRAYAVAWSDGGENRLVVGDPEVSHSIVWGLFGDWGPGAFLSYHANVASHSFPTNEPAVFGGGPFDISKWKIRGTGQVGLALQGNSTGLGTDKITLTIALKSYNFGVTNPFWYDYSALGGAEAYFTLTHILKQPQTWASFDVEFKNNGSNGGKSPTMFQWGLEVIGGGVEELREAGPITGGFFLPNWGSWVTNTRNVQIYAVRGDYQIHLFPCTAPPAGTPFSETHA